MELAHSRAGINTLQRFMPAGSQNPAVDSKIRSWSGRELLFLARAISLLELVWSIDSAPSGAAALYPASCGPLRWRPASVCQGSFCVHLPVYETSSSLYLGV